MPVRGTDFLRRLGVFGFCFFRSTMPSAQDCPSRHRRNSTSSHLRRLPCQLISTNYLENVREFPLLGLRKPADPIMWRLVTGLEGSRHLTRSFESHRGESTSVRDVASWSTDSAISIRVSRNSNTPHIVRHGLRRLRKLEDASEDSREIRLKVEKGERHEAKEIRQVVHDCGCVRGRDSSVRCER